MADNVDINPGSGVAIAADDIGSVFWQRFKLTLGADGVNDGDVSSSNRLPTAPQGDVAHDAADAGSPLKIGGYASGSAPSAVAGGDRVNAWFDLNGRQAAFLDQGIAGDVAHDAADSGSPIKIGGKVSTTTPAAVANGDRVDAWWDEYGRLHAAIDQGVGGDIAHDAADSGNPLKIGGYASSSAPSAVAGGDRVNAWFDLNGRLGAFLDQGIGGDVAHDAADSGKPFKIGGYASGSAPTAVAGGDRVNAWFDLSGRQVTYSDLGVGQRTDAIYDGTTELTPKFATYNGIASAMVSAVVGKKIRVLAAFFFCGSGVTRVAEVKDGSGGSVLLEDFTPTVPGVVLPFNPLGWFETSANTDLFLSSVSGTGNIAATLMYVEV